MRKIIDYKIVKEWGSFAVIDIMETVEKEMKNGWQPLGGIAIINDEHLLQTMVKYEKE